MPSINKNHVDASLMFRDVDTVAASAATGDTSTLSRVTIDENTKVFVIVSQASSAGTPDLKLEYKQSTDNATWVTTDTWTGVIAATKSYSFNPSVRYDNDAGNHYVYHKITYTCTAGSFAFRCGLTN